MEIPLLAPGRNQRIEAGQTPHPPLPGRKFPMAVVQARTNPILAITPVQQQDGIGIVAQNLSKQAIAVKAGPPIAINQITIKYIIFNPSKHRSISFNIFTHDSANFTTFSISRYSAGKFLVHYSMPCGSKQTRKAARSTPIETNSHYSLHESKKLRPEKQID
jgi:hypothetical protein